MIAFACEGVTPLGSLDEAPGEPGLLAAPCFRAEAPDVRHPSGFGKVATPRRPPLFGNAAEVNALVPASPWVVERAPTACRRPPRSARAMAERLRSPREWPRLARDGIDFGRLRKGLRALARKPDHARARRSPSRCAAAP